MSNNWLINIEVSSMIIKDILKLEESVKIEFKESITENMYKTVSAVSNNEEGTVYYGISNDKKIVGY